MPKDKQTINWAGKTWEYKGKWSGTNRNLSLYKQKEGEDYITVNENRQVVFRFQYIKNKTPSLKDGSDVL